MNTNFVMSEQQLRDMALNAMLLALDAQSAALHSMDREHSLGVENGYSIDHLRQKSKDLIQSAQVIVKNADTMQLDELREKIVALSMGSVRLKHEADQFKASCQGRAKNRYEHLELVLGDNPNKDTAVGSAPGRDPRQLTVEAGRACLRAEVDEYDAFALQIHAMCNLALEYALNAAAKAARSFSNI